MKKRNCGEMVMSPQAPKRPCPGAGARTRSCPNLISRGEKVCSVCMPAYMNKQHVQSKEYEQRPGRQWMHSTRWRKARVAFLSEHPLCVECIKVGRVTPATVVDHKIPHNGNYELFWKSENWQGLCSEHHSRKTASEDGGYGNIRR